MTSTIGKFIKNFFGDKELKENSIVINNPQTVIIQSPQTPQAPQVPYYNDEENEKENIVNTTTSLENIENENNPEDDNYYDEDSDDGVSKSSPVIGNPKMATYDDLNNVDSENNSEDDNYYDEDFEEEDKQENYNDTSNINDVNYNDINDEYVESVDDSEVSEQEYYDDENDEQNIPQQNFNQEPLQQTETPQQNQLYYDDENDEQIVDPSQQNPIVNQPLETPIGSAPISTQIDPNTGQPIELNTLATQPQIDPNTGQPIELNTLSGSPQIDPNTGQPIDVSSVADPYDDEDDWDIGSSENVPDSGTPVKIKDINRISELRYIFEKLNDLQEILDNELSIKYERMNKKVKDAIEYFNLIITNLDSYKEQIDELIIKYKRFLYIATIEINKMKEEDIEENDDEI